MNHLARAKEHAEIGDEHYDEGRHAMAESYYQSARLNVLISIAESLEKLASALNNADEVVQSNLPMNSGGAR